MKHIHKKQILRFLIVGSTSVLIDYVIYRLLNQYLPIAAAKAISFISGSIVGFIINKVWTFESKSLIRYEIPKYIILYLSTACANAIVNHLVLSLFSWQLFAFLCATGVSTILNFLGLKFIVFKSAQ